MEMSELCQFWGQMPTVSGLPGKEIRKNVHGCSVKTTYCGIEWTRAIQVYKDRLGRPNDESSCFSMTQLVYTLISGK